MSYVEFPADPVVNVRWKKKKPDDGGGGDPNDPGEPSDFRQTCGAFQNGILHGLPAGFSGIYVLGDYWLYMTTADQNPGRLPTKPITYFNKFADYQWFTRNNALPYIWSVPNSWTITGRNIQNFAPYTIKEFRNINIQVFDGHNAAPDQVAVETIEIWNIQSGETYPPLFICENETGVISPDPHVLVQAHSCPKPGAAGCYKFETTGTWWPGTDNDPGTPAACLAMLPPQPPGWGTFFDPRTLVQYPAPGSTADPVRPPPVLRRPPPEPARPAPLIVPQRIEV